MKTLEILSRENNVPIEFYGKLEDQFENPVVGAEIAGSTIIYSGTSSGSKTVTATSDGNGYFTLDAGKGESLGVMPRKPGYALATTSTDFKYSHLFENYYVPDPRNPTIIKMWKLQGAEHLTGFDIRTEVPIDGTPIIFDLQTGRRVQNGGDVVVTISSSLKPNLVEEYDWRVTIQPVDGGILESSGLGLGRMFQAPDSGYQPSFTVKNQKGQQSWSSRFNGGFFFNSRNDTIYGKFGFTIVTDVVGKNGTPITLKGYLNPAGSRNLEGDATMVTGANP